MNEKVRVYPYQRPSEGKAKTPGKVKKPGCRPSGFRESAWGVVKAPETYIYAGIALVLSRALVLGEIFPFGSAFFAAAAVVSRKQTIPALMGLTLGMWLFRDHIPFAALGLTVLTLAALLRSVSGSGRAHWIIPPILVSIVQVVVRSVFLGLQQELVMYEIVAIVMEALMAGVLTFVFMVALTIVHERQPFAEAAYEEVVCGVLLGASVVIGLDGIRVYGISLQAIVGKLGILVAAGIGGSGGGSAMGVVAGLIPCLTGAVTPSSIGFSALSGLLAGVFRGFGKTGIILGFLLGNLLLSFYFLEPAGLYQLLAESLLGCALFILVPGIKWTGLPPRQEARGPKAPERATRMAMNRFEEVARGFSELSRTFEQLSASVVAPREQGVATLLNAIAGRVCRGCPVFDACWDKEFFRTYKAIVDLLALVEVKGPAAEQQVPQELGDKCVRVEQLVSIVNHLMETRKLNYYWGNRVAETGELISSQLEGVARVMGRLAGDIQDGLDFDQQLEARMRAEMDGLGLPVTEVAAIRLAAGQFEIRVKLPTCNGWRRCPESMASLISGLTGQPMLTSRHNCRSGESCELVFEHAWPYMIDVGVASRARRMVSGDTHTAITLRGGKHMLVLSDGMGFGPRAAKESRATVDLLEKLLASGFEKDLAIRTVNHFLSLRSVEETFSTLDLALVDLGSGMTDFVKIGSAPSFIVRRSQVEIIRSVSLPLGVMDSIEVECEQRLLFPGDIVVMVTDGVLDGCGEDSDRELWLIKELEAGIGDDAQLMAESLLEAALERTSAEQRDDMTLLVARFDHRQKMYQPAAMPAFLIQPPRASTTVAREADPQ